MSSIRQMLADGTAKRADAVKLAYSALHVEPGFNLRIEDDEFQAGVEVLAQYILDGGMVPPLEVRPRAEGGMFIVDGHRRHRAYGLAIERGAPIEWIEVRLFAGNDADRVARIMTSAEGRPLSPLETSRGYKRLAAFGLTADDIARRVGKTRAHVEQLLLLSNANQDVQNLVAAGGVSAALAVQTVRKHGEQAGDVLGKELEKAKAAGKKKVTAGTMAPRKIPAQQANGLFDSVDAVLDELGKETRVHLAGLETTEQRNEPVTITLPAWAVLDLIEVHAGIQAERAKLAQKQRDADLQAAQTDIEDAAA